MRYLGFSAPTRKSTIKGCLIAAFFLSNFISPLARLCGLFFGLNFMNVFRKLALIFQRGRNFAPIPTGFVISNAGNKCVDNSGNYWVA
jgi:hypothetical protein